MIENLALIPFIIGFILTCKDVATDVRENNRITINVPINLAMHSILFIPMMMIFCSVAASTQWRNLRNKE